MSETLIPENLYYTTVIYSDGRIESPRFLVFNKRAEGLNVAKEHFANSLQSVESIFIKELKYVGTISLPDEAYILVPHNDNGLEDDFDYPEKHQRAITDFENSEEGGLCAIFPDPQDEDELECTAYLMGPVSTVDSAEEFIDFLINEPLEVSIEIPNLHLYKRTGEDQEVKVS